MEPDELPRELNVLDVRLITHNWLVVRRYSHHPLYPRVVDERLEHDNIANRKHRA